MEFCVLKVVMAANWWYRRGGLGAVMFDEAEALHELGHDVFPFAAAHPENVPTEWSRFFVPFTETSHLGAGISAPAKMRLAADLVYNRTAARQFAALLRAVRPNVVHLHNTARQLSPSILAAARDYGVPVVMTLHDYGLICPQGQLYKGERQACTPPNCLGGNVVHAVSNRCVKRSVVGSTMAAVEHLIHRSLRMYVDPVHSFVVPSEFLRDRILDAGLRGLRLNVVPNGLPDVSPAPRPPTTGGYFLFAGRLAREKGLDVLVQAARRAPEVEVVVAGDGPMRDIVSRAAPTNMRLVGHLGPDELRDAYRNTVATVVPSTWFENAPLTILDALRAGRGVIATHIGGHEELVRGGGGRLVPVGDPDAFATALKDVWRSRDAASRLGAEARANFDNNYHLEFHMKRLLSVYSEATNLLGVA